MKNGELEYAAYGDGGQQYLTEVGAAGTPTACKCQGKRETVKFH